MELLKQKTLVVGVCALSKELSGADGAASTPGYFLDVNGVACGLIFTFWDAGNWVLMDRQFGTSFGEYETFDEAAAAIRDGAWVREKHEEMAAADPDKAKVPAESVEIFRIDNPLKGRPGITLIPNSSAALDMLQDIYDDEEDADWDDEEDWDEDDDWNEVDEEDDWIDAKVEDEAEVEEDADWDEIDEEDEDDDWDDLDDEDDPTVVPLEPRATYVVDVAKLPVAIYSMFTAGAITWWEALDVGTGLPLWSTQSLSELMRVAPLFLVIARSINNPQETVPYIETIMALFEGLSRQSAEDYLRTGYLKANGREYLDLMNRLYADPLSLEDAFAAATRSEDK